MLKLTKQIKRLKNDPGFTMVEIIIALTICMILVGGLGSISRMSQQIFNGNRVVLENQQNGYFAMEMMLRDFRAALSVTASDPHLITFTDIDLNTITYELVDGEIRRTQGATVQTLATRITTLNFTYVDEAQNSTTLSYEVRRINIELQGTTAAGSVIRLANSVRPRNII